MKTEETYLFVDGAYLERTIAAHSEYYFGEDLVLDFERLGAGALKAFYYDAYPSRKQGESEADYQQEVSSADRKFNRISSHRGWHVNFGFTRGSGKKIRQKGVDVQLAMDAYTHCVRGNFKNITLLTGDLDFYPLIKSLVQEGAFVQLWYDPNTTSDELMRSADSRKWLNPRGILDVVSNKNLRSVPSWYEVPDPSLFQRKAIREGAYDKGEVKVVEVDARFLAINYRRDLGSYSALDDDDFDRLFYFVKSDLPHVEWGAAPNAKLERPAGAAAERCAIYRVPPKSASAALLGLGQVANGRERAGHCFVGRRGGAAAHGGRRARSRWTGTQAALRFKQRRRSTDRALVALRARWYPGPMMASRPKCPTLQAPPGPFRGRGQPQRPRREPPTSSPPTTRCGQSLRQASRARTVSVEGPCSRRERRRDPAGGSRRSPYQAEGRRTRRGSHRRVSEHAASQSWLDLVVGVCLVEDYVAPTELLTRIRRWRLRPAGRHRSREGIKYDPIAH